MFSDPSGRYPVIGDEVDERTSWHWVDAQTGDSRELPKLEQMSPLTNGTARASMLFLPSARQGPGNSGTPYHTLDLTTGNVATPLTQDSTEVWTAALAGDSAGRYALINAVSPGAGRMWLIDTTTGSATEIGTSSGNVNARVSPDGCQLAISVFDTVGKGRTSAVTGTSLLDGSINFTVSDALLLGWAEISPTG